MKGKEGSYLEFFEADELYSAYEDFYFTGHEDVNENVQSPHQVSGKDNKGSEVGLKNEEVGKKNLVINEEDETKENSFTDLLSETRKLLTSADYRLSLVFGNGEGEDKKKREKKIKDFLSLAPNIYPDTYVKKIKELINKSRSENEERQLIDLLKIPLTTEVKFKGTKAIGQIKEIIGTNPSLRSFCEAILGHLEVLSRFKEIRLKDLEKKEEYRNLSSLTFLLVGEKGSGKSWIGKVIAEILGLPYVFVDCANTDYLNLVGSSTQWSNSNAGLLARELIKEGRFPLVVIFDEVDKGGSSNGHNLIDSISHIIDPLKVPRDEFLDVPLLHYKIAIFILTANYIDVLPDYFKSRTVIYKITPIHPELRYRISVKELIEMTKQLDVDEKEIEPLLNDTEVIKRVTSLIMDLDLDLREIQQRFKVVLFRYQYMRKYENEKNIRFIDILMEELESVPKFYKRIYSKNLYKVGFVH